METVENQSGETSTEPVRLTFGEMEARLARLHDIASDKRTQFQARLRNFQRAGIPRGARAGRGNTVRYNAGQVFEVALALEFTQLGLLPERIVKVFNENKFPLSQAAGEAAKTLAQRGGFPADRERRDENFPVNTGNWWRTHDEADDPISIFLYFDPSALDALTYRPKGYEKEDMASASLYYGGPKLIQENIVRWTAGPIVRRLSIVNVTSLLWSLVQRTSVPNQVQFIIDVATWADDLQTLQMMETIPDDGFDPDNLVVIETNADIVQHADLIRTSKGIPTMVADAIIERAKLRVADADGELAAGVKDSLRRKALKDGDR